MSDNDSQPMQIYAGATETGDIKVDLFSGPLMSSVILSIQDEDAVIAIIQKAFLDAHRVLSGESLEDIIESNKESNAHLKIV